MSAVKNTDTNMGQPPKWQWKKKTVTITFDIDGLVDFGHVLNEWQAWTGWTQREECQKWKTSITHREHKRESQTYQTCLEDVKFNLGRDDMLKLMQMAKDRAEKRDTL